MQVMTPDDFGTSGVRWTVRVPGNQAYLDLQACDAPNFPDIRYEEFIAMPDKSPNTLYSSNNPNDPKWFPLYNSNVTTQKQVGDAVGLLVGSHGTETWAGSGVMIAPDLFLTNWHNGKPPVANFPDRDCWGEEVRQRTMVDLSWDTDGVSREYTVEEVVAKDKNLDFAILRVQPVTSLGVPRPAVLKDALATNGLPLFIIHHPLGLRKQIITTDCTVTNASYTSWFGNLQGTDFTHKCDTEGGSSGAPIFNSSGEVVGLHHRGYSPISQADCRLDKQNKAVHISKILAHLRQNPNNQSLLSKLRIRS
jgi:hypothetical protein